jgi:hypothetical protein
MPSSRGKLATSINSAALNDKDPRIVAQPMSAMNPQPASSSRSICAASASGSPRTFLAPRSCLKNTERIANPDDVKAQLLLIAAAEGNGSVLHMHDGEDRRPDIIRGARILQCLKLDVRAPPSAGSRGNVAGVRQKPAGSGLASCAALPE